MSTSPRQTRRIIGHYEQEISRLRAENAELKAQVAGLRTALVSLKSEDMGYGEWGIKCIQDHNAIIEEALSRTPEEWAELPR